MLASFPGSETNLKQLLKVHYKAIKIVRWLGTKLMHIFKETTTDNKSWAVSWERWQSQYIQSYCFPNILLDGWEGLRGFILQSKGAHFEKVATAHYFTFFS